MTIIFFSEEREDGMSLDVWEEMEGRRRVTQTEYSPDLLRVFRNPFG